MRRTQENLRSRGGGHGANGGGHGTDGGGHGTDGGGPQLAGGPSQELVRERKQDVNDEHSSSSANDDSDARAKMRVSSTEDNVIISKSQKGCGAR
jgi:hypothetical protein